MKNEPSAPGARHTAQVGDITIDAYQGPVLRLSFDGGHVTIDSDQAVSLILGLGYCLASDASVDDYFGPDGIGIELGDGVLMVLVDDYGVNVTRDEAQALMVQLSHLLVVTP